MYRPKQPRFHKSLLTYNHENFRLMHIAIRKQKFDNIMKRFFRARPERFELFTDRRLMRPRQLCERDSTHPIYKPPTEYKWSRRIKKLAKPRLGLPETTEMPKPRFWRRPKRIRRPIPPRRKYKISKRILNLAQPKRQFHVPVKEEECFQVSRAALKASCSVRVKELAKWKPACQEHLDLYYGVRARCHRTASEVKKSAVYLEKLAKHKFYPKYKYWCKLPIPVPPAALTAIATPRTEELAKPKIRKEYQPRGDEVSRSALQYIATEHICELAKAKKPHPEFRPQYKLPRPVSPGALRAQPSTRLQELAQPRNHQKTFERMRINMNAFKVKASALAAHCSDRIKELAVARRRR